jgi:hypothetical protein
MAFDTADSVAKNCETLIRLGRETLRLKYVTGNDRRAIEHGIYYLIGGQDLFKREDPESLREAARLFLAGAYYLGATCAVSSTEAEFWRRQSCSKGGEKKDAPQHQREVWVKYVRECVAKNPGISAAILTDSLLLDKEAPPLPASREYLVRRVREIKRAFAGKSDVFSSSSMAARLKENTDTKHTKYPDF